MLKKCIAFTLPAGLVLFLVYSLWDRFVEEIPDRVAIPWMILSVLLMLIGVAYHSYCFGKRKNPYNFK